MQTEINQTQTKPIESKQFQLNQTKPIQYKHNQSNPNKLDQIQTKETKSKHNPKTNETNQI